MPSFTAICWPSTVTARAAAAAKRPLKDVLSQAVGLAAQFTT
ncbi:MAG TPA: hypothetical protein VLZ05_12450 [Mycobacterium sp.]|nr:hypothetical protein [Mycobacterium sp.]HUH69600.1 hypothetical protein [Mycobacterium sp.]